MGIKQSSWVIAETNHLFLMGVSHHKVVGLLQANAHVTTEICLFDIFVGMLQSGSDKIFAPFQNLSN